jgi:hypothetical protein
MHGHHRARLDPREQKPRRATSTIEMGGHGWRYKTSSASAALTSFGVRGKLPWSTIIHVGAACTVPPPAPSHSTTPARAKGQSLVPGARLCLAKHGKNQMQNSAFRLFKAAQAQGLRSNSSAPHQVLPNPSFKRTPNGVARQPASAGASPHFALAVRRTTPPGSA